MSNDISKFIPSLWSARIQKRREKLLVAKPVSSFEEQSNLKFGNKVYRPKGPEFLVNDYSRTGTVSLQDVKTVEQYLDVDKSKEVSFYIDDLDRVQSKYDVEADAIKSAAYSISQAMDYDRFKETINAYTYSDDGDRVSGTAGNPYSPAATTLTEFIENSKAKLRLSGAEQDREWYLVATPKMISYIAQSFIKDGFNLADSGLRNGYKGDAYGLKVYESTNLLHEVKFSATTIVNGNTFQIAGVTFTFATAKSTTVGAMTIDSTTNEDTLLIAEDLVNGIANAAANDISAENREKLRKLGVYAVANTTAKTLTVYANGPFTFAGTTTTFVPSALIAHCEMGRQGAVDMVVQIDPKVQKNKVDNKTGYNYIIYDLYGIKTFDEGKYRMLDVRLAG